MATAVGMAIYKFQLVRRNGDMTNVHGTVLAHGGNNGLSLASARALSDELSFGVRCALLGTAPGGAPFKVVTIYEDPEVRGGMPRRCGLGFAQQAAPATGASQPHRVAHTPQERPSDGSRVYEAKAPAT